MCIFSILIENKKKKNKYAEAISDLKLQFDSWFVDVKINEYFGDLFSIPFGLSVEDVPEIMKMDIIDLQSNRILK